MLDLTKAPQQKIIFFGVCPKILELSIMWKERRILEFRIE
jgi:hypothetical protein